MIITSSTNDSWFVTNVPNTASMIFGSRRLRLAASAAMLACVGIGLLLHRSQVTDAAAALRSIPLVGLVSLVAALSLHKTVHAFMLASTLEDLSLGQALVVTEAYAGCSNSMIGGAAVGTGVKVAMLRAWGCTGEAIAASITATGVIPGIALWATAFAVTVPSVVTGSAGTLHRAVCAVAFIGAVGPITCWGLLLRQPRRVAWVARKVHRAVVMSMRLPMPVRLRHRLGLMDIGAEAERLRDAASPFLGRRGATTMAYAIASQFTLAFVLLVALRALGVSDQVTPLEALRCMALARVLGSLAPVPGGLGLLDVGLLGALMSAGATRPGALAAIGVFRALTFVLPMATGPVALLGWRRTQRGLSGHRTTPSLLPAHLPSHLGIPVLAERPAAAVA